MDVTFSAGVEDSMWSSSQFLLLVGCHTDVVTGALADMLHHEVKAVLETADTIR